LALVILNIPSYGGGADLWGHNVSSKWTEQNIGDRKFEVIGIRGAFHLGQIQGKIAKGVKLAQGNKIEILCGKFIEAQIDGEPFKLSPSFISINLHNQVPVLLNSLKDKKGKAEAKLLGSLGQPKEMKIRKQDSKNNLNLSRKIHSPPQQPLRDGILRKSKSVPETKVRTVESDKSLGQKRKTAEKDKIGEKQERSAEKEKSGEKEKS